MPMFKVEENTYLTNIKTDYNDIQAFIKKKQIFCL